MQETENIHPENSKSVSNGLWIVFMALFLLSSGLLVYYQFYQGYGNWRFTILHKSNDTTFLSQLKYRYPQKRSPDIKKDNLAVLSDSLKMQIWDSLVQKTDSIPPGTYYEVQIGIIENYNLKKYDAIFNRLHAEITGKSTKLTLGRFKDPAQADAFKKDMIRIGVKDAWVRKIN